MSTTSELNFVGAGSRLLWSPTFCWAHLHWRLTFFCKAHLHWRLTFFCQARLHWRLTFFCQARPLVKHFIIGVRSLPSRNITCYALLSPGRINRICLYVWIVLFTGIRSFFTATTPLTPLSNPWFRNLKCRAGPRSPTQSPEILGNLLWGQAAGGQEDSFELALQLVL